MNFTQKLYERFHRNDKYFLTCGVVKITLDCFFSVPVNIINEFKFGEKDIIESYP